MALLLANARRGSFLGSVISRWTFSVDEKTEKMRHLGRDERQPDGLYYLFLLNPFLVHASRTESSITKPFSQETFFQSRYRSVTFLWVLGI